MTDTIDYRFSLWGPYVLEATVEKEFVDILLEKGKESREKNLDATRDLAGALEHEYYYDDVDDWFFSRMKPFINVYIDGAISYMGKTLWSKTPNLSTITRWELIRLWINFQQAKEYNPPHDHSGDLSFVIYLQVPDEIKEENERTKGKQRNEGPGMICFDYGQKMPFSIDKQYRLPLPGDIFIFPAWLMHHVHSFQSNVERISVSGNIFFNYD